MLHFPARLLPLLLLLLAAACTPDDAVNQETPPELKELEGTWLLSNEESYGDTLVYRPNTHKFPASRGRTGFAIRTYGRFEQFDIAPTDGLTGRPGTWAADGDTRLHIHLDQGPDPDYTIKILSLKKQVLKLRRQRLIRIE